MLDSVITGHLTWYIFRFGDVQDTPVLSIGVAFVCCLSDAGAERVEKLLGVYNIYTWVGFTLKLAMLLCRGSLLKMVQHILSILHSRLSIDF
ncbi:Hypothetical predicted protein [Cloeon dipterum]|uniref:Uncharacterized protein n=1 Tax=Cloeon dipterum TaxID=197152 RepID=A0A8S1DT74_9INSE|nr:Hypothetical predicted protein [Cloeon dipterum]